MNDRGIDYGLGKTNIDLDSGIRYGVIHTNHLHEWIWESFEPYYGEPSCPSCEGTVEEVFYNTDEEVEDYVDKDFTCHYCKESFYSDEVYPMEPYNWYIDDGKYVATLDEMGDVFITKSPYYTHAQFCSPCAPGACYLTNPTPEGDRAYCFGPDFFEEGQCPYPVYSVETGELVNA